MGKYQSYKPSGVEWIGEIPNEWSTKRLTYSLKIQKGKIPSELLDEPIVNGLPYLSMDVLRGNEPTEFSIDKNIVEVKDGDIGILWDGSNSGEIIKINRNGILSSTVSLLTIIDQGLNKEFGYYLLKLFEKDFKSNTTGMGIPHVNGNYVRETKLIIPPISEQLQIVRFLDDKTDLIDKLISTKEQKITLLKEQRTSLINEVVTKGLNPNVKMKDSGVEWIGEIPEHWGVFKMKYGVKHINEKGLTTKDDVKISPENVESMTGVCFNYYSEYEGEGMKFRGGDILLNKLRLYLKKIVFTDVDGYSMGEMIVLRCFENLFNRYFYFLIFHQGLIDLLDSQSNGVKLPRVSPEIIMNSLIPYPPINEQHQIVEFLDEKTKEIDDIVQLEQQKIDLLKEYRQSLISEVVTGKIKVTN